MSHCHYSPLDRILAVTIRPRLARFLMGGVLLGTALTLVRPLSGATAFGEAEAFSFTDRYCSSCHNDVDKEGGLDLTSLKYTPNDAVDLG